MAKRGKILVIEDNAATLDSLDALLGAYRFEVVSASDGVAGLERARSERPDLIVLDAMLPRLDGFAVCRALKADPGTREIPVLFMTALDKIGDVEDAFQAGAVDYLIKPFDGQRLLGKVRKALYSSAA